MSSNNPAHAQTLWFRQYTIRAFGDVWLHQIDHHANIGPICTGPICTHTEYNIDIETLESNNDFVFVETRAARVGVRSTNLIQWFSAGHLLDIQR